MSNIAGVSRSVRKRLTGQSEVWRAMETELAALRREVALPDCELCRLRERCARLEAALKPLATSPYTDEWENVANHVTSDGPCVCAGGFCAFCKARTVLAKQEAKE